MTSLTFNTPVNSINSILAMPALSSYTKKANTGKPFSSYAAAPKNWYRKLSAKRVSFDWDLNKNELEFE